MSGKLLDLLRGAAALLFVLGLLSGSAPAQEAPGAEPAKSIASPAVPGRLQGPYLVADVESGQVFEHHDAVRPWFPASTTKLMTLYVVFRAVATGELTLDSPVTISARAAGQPPSKMGFRPGTMLTLENALKIMMVKSANDIAVAVAETVGGSEADFAERMNREAQTLGMRRSHFVNPHGLPDPRQITTARDMAVLARALLKDFPQHRGFLNIHAIQFGKTLMRTYNPLLERYQGATGMKTGFICASGYNLVASAQRGGRELVAVVFGEYGGQARAEHAVGLLNAAFVASGVQPAIAMQPAPDAQRFMAGETIAEGNSAPGVQPGAPTRQAAAPPAEPAAAQAAEQPGMQPASQPQRASQQPAATAQSLPDEQLIPRPPQPDAVSLTLADVASGAEFSEPFDMRPLVCAPRKAAAASEANMDTDPDAAGQTSNLSAPAYLGPPQQVAVISQADPNAKPGQPGYIARLPKARPDLPSDEITSGVADAFAPVSESGGDGASGPEQAIAR